ncbi:MAG: hypothetical protein Q9217_003013 [Psora testacea]
MSAERVTDVVCEKPFDHNKCNQYIIKTLGEEEQIPTYFNIQNGTAVVLSRLKLRYGISEIEQYVELLHRHLGKGSANP